jgi:hypothetical protein
VAAHGDAGALFRDGVAAARAALAAGPRTQAELSRAVTAALPGHASADCRACRARHVDQGLFRTIGLAVGWVRAHGLDASRFVLPDGWAAGRVDRDAGSAAAALLAWHLRAHSPTTPAELATFLAVGRAEAAMRWLAAPELVEVEHGGGRAWLPAADLDAVRGATLPEGTRLLPPYDALMEVPDRALLVPDPAGRRTVWRTFANPGVALVDGEVSCAWRSSVRAGRLEVRLLPLGGWHPAHRRRLERELVGVAALRGVPPGPVEVT